MQSRAIKELFITIRKKKRIEKLESEKNDSYSLTTFEYNAENKLKMMKVDVDANGVKTTIVTEILRMKSSKDFPDKLFEF